MLYGIIVKLQTNPDIIPNLYLNTRIGVVIIKRTIELTIEMTGR